LINLSETSENRFGVALITIVAIVFGLRTIKSGGAVLFIDGEDRRRATMYRFCCGLISSPDFFISSPASACGCGNDGLSSCQFLLLLQRLLYMQR